MAHKDHPVCVGICAAMEASPKSAGSRYLKLIDLLRSNVEGLRAAFPTEDECVAWAVGVYDTYIAPQDIPWVPQWVEDQIDKAARTTIEGIVRSVYPG